MPPAMSNVVLYGSPKSTYVRTARMALVEKGVAYEMAEPEYGQASHRALHPYLKIPALKHGDVTMFETLSIVEYIDAAFDGPALKPTDPVQRAQVYMWSSAIGDYIYGDVVRNYIIPMARQRPIEDEGDVLAKVRTHLEFIDAGLEGGYLVGDTLTQADMFLAPIMFYLSMFPHAEKLYEGLDNIPKAAANIRERECFTATMPM